MAQVPILPTLNEQYKIAMVYGYLNTRGGWKLVITDAWDNNQ